MIKENMTAMIKHTGAANIIKMALVFAFTLMVFANATGRPRQESNSIANVIVTNNTHASQNSVVLNRVIHLNLDKTATVLEGVKQIARQAELKLSYNAKLSDLRKTIGDKLEYKKITVEEALRKVLQGTKIRFKIFQSGQLTLFYSEKVVDRTIQTGIVTGTVYDAETNKPLPGASVYLKETTLGDATDADGKFLINDVEGGNYILVARFIGYKTNEKEITVMSDEKTIVNFKLEPIVGELAPIVVDAGYYNVSQRQSTGSFSVISSEDIESQPVTNVIAVLIGRIPGLNITPRSGTVGAAPEIEIRGINSLDSGTSPLFVVDGVPFPESFLTIGTNHGLDGARLSTLLNINPYNIKQIVVLKGADATSLYGSRGANGVVLIKTKRARGEELRVNLNTRIGFKSVGRKIDYLTLDQYETMRREALKNDGITPNATNAPDLFEWNTQNIHNWQEELMGSTNVTQSTNLSISGGNNNTHFYIAGGYQTEGSVTPGDHDFNRKSVRASFSHASGDRFNVRLTSAYSITNLNNNEESMANFINLAPHYPVFREDGTPNWDAPRGFPLASTLKTYLSKSKTYSGNIDMSYEVMDNLTLKLNAGFTNNITKNSVLEPVTSIDPDAFFNTAQATDGSYKTNTWIIDPQGEYKAVLSNHTFGLLIGGTFQKTHSETMVIRGRDFATDVLLRDIAAAGTKTISIGWSEYTYASLYGRLSYDYDKKIFVNFNLRRDGSSRFGPGNRFGNFWSVGVGWIFSDSDWFNKTIPFISFGKLRASFGTSGNDQIGDYGYISSYSAITSGVLSYNGFSLIPTRIANAEYRWERTEKAEVGLELKAFDNRISFSVTLYRNLSSNLLITRDLPDQTAFYGYQINFPGTVRNKGYEIVLTTENIRTNDFQWSTSVNLSQTENVLKSFPGGLEDTFYRFTYEVGKSLNMQEGYVFTGLNHSGAPTYKDVNGDGTVNYKDRTFLGDGDPLYGGITNTLSYRNFTFSFFIKYTRDNGFLNYLTFRRPGTIGTNFTTYVLDRWQKPGDEKTTNIPRFSPLSSSYSWGRYTSSDLWRVTQHIFRLSNVNFSYNLPVELVNRLNISNAQVFINAHNVWVSDKYKEYRLDPLTGNGAAPPLRTITLGVNITF